MKKAPAKRKNKCGILRSVTNEHRKVSPEETARKVFARRGIASRAWVRREIKPFIVEEAA